MSDVLPQGCDETWREIVLVHNAAKKLFLLAEETEPHQFKSFLQPYNELRHAYEHVVRMVANHLGMDEAGPDCSYCTTSLRRALGHEYRAFFDCADWLSVILRELIQHTLQGFSQDAICAALPDYYSNTKQRIIEITESIAGIRGAKDIAKSAPPGEVIAPESGVIIEVQEYMQKVEELRAIHKAVNAAMPSLLEYRKKEREKERSDWWWRIVAAVLAGIVMFIVGQVVARSSGTSSVEPEPPVQEIQR